MNQIIISTLKSLNKTIYELCRDIKSQFSSAIKTCKNRKKGFDKADNHKSMDHSSLKQLMQSSKERGVYRHWGNDKLFYCEGVNYLINKLGCYWLIDEIESVVLSKILSTISALRSDEDIPYFWCWSNKIELAVYTDRTLVLTVMDAYNEPWFEHKIDRVNFPILKEPLKFFLEEVGKHYYYLSIATC